MDTFQKVRSGDRLKIPASTYNAMVDAAKYFSQRQNSGAGLPGNNSDAGLVRIKNTSEQDCARFDVLGISGVLFNPTDAADQFRNGIVFTGAVPTSADHSDGRFVICAVPIPAGEIGFAFASGICQVQISVTDESHQYADLTDGDHTMLSSSSSGPVCILWKEAGTGTKWAIARFGGSGGGGVALIELEVVESIGYPKPERPEDTDTYKGRSWYNCRPVGANAAEPWAEGLDYIGYYQDPSNLSIASEQDIDFRCLVSHKSTQENRPDPDKPKTAYWEKVEYIRIDRFLGMESRGALDMRNSDIWFEKGDRPLAMKIGDYYYFIAPCPVYTGEPDIANRRHNSLYKIPVVVFA